MKKCLSILAACWCLNIWTICTPSATIAGPITSRGFSGSFSGESILDSIVNDRVTELGITRWSLLFSYYQFKLGYDYTDFNWNKPDKLALMNGIKKKPWGDLNRFFGRVDNIFPVEEFDDVSVFIGFGVASSFEKELKSSYTAELRGGLQIQLTPSSYLRIGGAAIHSKLKRLDHIPIVNIKLKKTSDTGFEANIGYPATDVYYWISNKLYLHSKVSIDTNDILYGSNSYLLAKSNPVLRRGYAEVKERKAEASCGYSLRHNLWLTLGTTYYWNRNIVLYNANCNKAHTVYLENNFGGMLQLNFGY